MIEIDAQQELFTAIKLRLEARGYAVYDGFLPPEDTPYPFYYLGNNQQADQATKNALIGEVRQTIHIWHNNPRQRGKVSEMLQIAKAVCLEIEHTDNFKWLLVSATQQIFPDTTTKTPLLHGVFDPLFKFS